MLAPISAPSDLGLRLPQPGSVPGTAKAPEAGHQLVSGDAVYRAVAVDAAGTATAGSSSYLSGPGGPVQKVCGNCFVMRFSAGPTGSGRPGHAVRCLPCRQGHRPSSSPAWSVSGG